MDFFFFKYGGKYRFLPNLTGILPLFGEISLKFIDIARVPAHSRKFPNKFWCASDLNIDGKSMVYGAIVQYMIE